MGNTIVFRSILQVVSLATGIFLLSVNGFAARASDAQRLELAREMILVAGGFEQYESVVKDQFEASMSLMLDQVRARRPDLTETQLLEIRHSFAAYRDEFAKFDEAKIVAVYADVFTASELQGWIDIYQTEAGRAMILKGPQLARRLAAIQQTPSEIPLIKMLEVLDQYPQNQNLD